jgi:hypothetical protein
MSAIRRNDILLIVIQIYLFILGFSVKRHSAIYILVSVTYKHSTQYHSAQYYCALSNSAELHSAVCHSVVSYSIKYHSAECPSA